jgi:hypothetical protein
MLSKPLGWSDIRSNATSFVHEWQGTKRERAESQTFVNEFFAVFGINRKRVSSFEYAVKKLNRNTGFIDAFWPGRLIIEMKSAGKDLGGAIDQAYEYLLGLDDAELPKFVMVSNFERIALRNLETNERHEFALAELVDNIHLFGFMAGYRSRTYSEQDPVNIRAAEKMGRLHDRLEEIGYSGHELQVYLVRLLFCLFAEDTGIFNSHQFQDIVEYKSSTDGRDLAGVLSHVFDTLNTPVSQRMSTLDEDYARLPYVNGKLFAETLRPPAFDAQMRDSLLEACRVDWSGISPAIFGSLFQSVMNPTERRNLGAHYTSEENILKVIRPLFLDELWERFEKVKGSVKDLGQLHKAVASLRILDPACGCGNFLVIAYRELRRLELEILKSLSKHGQRVVNIETLVLLNVDMMCGIELEEFPAQIAQVALWLVDHQMNLEVAAAFGEYFRRLPLTTTPSILIGNALRIDWITAFKFRFDFILGNPPFIGKTFRNAEQTTDVANIFGAGGAKLDYVTCWFMKSADYLKTEPNTAIAFVSTNSITQGEQVGLLWKKLLETTPIHINFAHRTFAWRNDANGNAAVHVVIIGFSSKNSKGRIFDYETVNGHPIERGVIQISPYLTEGKMLAIDSRRTPLNAPLPIAFGSMPNDGGNLLLTEQECAELIASEPACKPYIRRISGSREFLYNIPRYCLWLIDCPPEELRTMHNVQARVQSVASARRASSREATRRLASQPSLFGEIRQPDTRYLAIPKTSGEFRTYIPMDFREPEHIATTELFTIPAATEFHFGILSSLMHMVWVRNVGGRLKNDYRYSAELVYNTFPWPLKPSANAHARVVEAALAVLNARVPHISRGATFADLYDPLAMPVSLIKAHEQLNRAVDLLYRPQKFTGESNRLAYLLEQYETLTVKTSQP